MIRSVERRSTERVKVMLSATVEQEGETAPTRLANLSPEGALVVGPALRDGAFVLLQRNGADIWGSVTWSRGNESGLKFEKTFDVGAALRPIPAPRRATAPRSRRPGLRCVPISSAEKQSLERWLNTGPTLVRD